MIIQILEFSDMLHELIFNFYTNIQTWMSIVTKLILKYNCYVFLNQEIDFQWWYLYSVATSSCILNPEYKVQNMLMISPRHSTSFSLIKISLSLYAILQYLIHILKVFFGFYCFILQIYCLEAPIIGLQCLYQRSPQLS